MANTYTQMNIHAVFSVKGRSNFISEKWRDELFRYMAGTLKETKNYSLAVGGYKDHIHIFFELHPTISVSDVLKNAKAKSSKWINEKGFVAGKFEWQAGYGAFSYSRSQRNRVIQYIMKQEEHHRKGSFKDEYLTLLRRNEIKYEDAYLFEFYE
ncbi:REP element-mobilizing transposase RayT [Draconibacterium orientale]|uniref:Transposase n=1 Tax=Draconibacterium orientale TaxID=1168034 RepID=X5D9N6_9BACT|nr:IS200/IS605 family transposase [Draconibacterium orientale]AHW59493.1 transposase [Draconibacterium orientale]SES89186.1 REP element-mobilizing transposase RayT [Draconibacterium orientale]